MASYLKNHDIRHGYVVCSIENTEVLNIKYSTFEFHAKPYRLTALLIVYSKQLKTIDNEILDKLFLIEINAKWNDKQYRAHIVDRRNVQCLWGMNELSLFTIHHSAIYVYCVHHPHMFSNISFLLTWIMRSFQHSISSFLF